MDRNIAELDAYIRNVSRWDLERIQQEYQRLESEIDKIEREALEYGDEQYSYARRLILLGMKIGSLRVSLR